ncbi:MAG: RluA family pseudouridine synthase [Clostridiales bacterium]|nr:RluA family pseudouridine synthase [Clostridiales bacterium]
MPARTIAATPDAPDRLDVFVAANANVTRSRAGALIRDGFVRVDGTIRSKAGWALKGGEAVEITIPEAAPARLVPQDIPIDIVYQDSDVAVVYKPSGMVVHPAPGNPDGTLVNALMQKLDGLSGIGGEIRPGIVHRIDKDTSGLLLIAKNDFAHVSLAEQIKAHSVHRAYMAIVIGAMREEEGDIDAPIGRHPTDRKRMAIVEDGREAQTHWRVVESLKGCTLVECRLTTGRTHQIRVHMASIGHPVLGDPVYGPKRSPYPVSGGQLLHAYRIGFKHPVTGEEMIFEAEPEERFRMWVEKLGGSIVGMIRNSELTLR